MRVLLAGPDHEENLSIRYVSAALLHAGHETVLAAFNSPADIIPVADAAQDAGNRRSECTTGFRGPIC